MEQQCSFQSVETIVDEPFRIFVREGSRRHTALSKMLQQVLSFVGDTASAGQTTDNLSFIVRNRKLIQRTHCARHKQHHIARSHEDNVSSLQTKSRVNQTVTRIER